MNDATQYRSSCFWRSDVERIVDDVKVAAEDYRPESRRQFLMDVADALREAANEHSEPTGESDGG